MTQVQLPSGTRWDNYLGCVSKTDAVGTVVEYQAAYCTDNHGFDVRVLRRTDTNEIIGSAACCNDGPLWQPFTSLSVSCVSPPSSPPPPSLPPPLSPPLGGVHCGDAACGAALLSEGWKVLSEWGTVDRFNESLLIDSHDDFLAKGWFVPGDGSVAANSFNLFNLPSCSTCYDTDPQVTQWFAGSNPQAAYEHYGREFMPAHVCVQR